MKKIKLYDYQQKMLEEIINVLTTKEITRYRKKKGYEEGNSVVMQMPTGTGKTYVMASVVKWFLDNYEKGEVWIVAHRRELVEQIAADTGQILPGLWGERNGTKSQSKNPCALYPMARQAYRGFEKGGLHTGDDRGGRSSSCPGTLLQRPV